MRPESRKSLRKPHFSNIVMASLFLHGKLVSARGKLILYELKIEHGIAMVEISGSDRISRSSLCFDPDCLSSSNHPDAPLPPPWTGAVNIGPSLQCNLSEFTKVRDLPTA